MTSKRMDGAPSTTACKHGVGSAEEDYSLCSIKMGYLRWRLAELEEKGGGA